MTVALLRRMRRWKSYAIRIFYVGVAVSLAVGIPLLTVPRGMRWYQARQAAAKRAAEETPEPPAITLSPRDANCLFVPHERWDELGIQLTSIDLHPPSEELKLDGVLYLDPDMYSLVRSRFTGEVMEIAQIAVSDGHGVAEGKLSQRAIRFGDTVQKGELLAVVWSRELGEKKSELAEALSSLHFDQETLNRLKSVQTSIPETTLREAERRVRSGMIAVERIEKTLRSWRLSNEEIQKLRESLEREQKRDANRGDADRVDVDDWARVEIRSPINGTIVEKNVTLGSLVDLDDTLFKIANLDHLDVRAYAYEEDLSQLQNLRAEHHQWTIRVKGNPELPPIEGSFDRIGNLIDPVQHTGLVMGWVDNENRALRVGQFVSATVKIPTPIPLLCVPATAVVDLDGKTVILAQSSSSPDDFRPWDIEVIRRNEDMVCVSVSALQSQIGQVDPQTRVVASGAVELLAEYRTAVNLRDSQAKADEQPAQVDGKVNR